MPERRRGVFLLWIFLVLLLIVLAYAVIFFSANAGRTATTAWVFWNVERAWIWALGVAAAVGAIAYPLIRGLFWTFRRLLEGRDVGPEERRP